MQIGIRDELLHQKAFFLSLLFCALEMSTEVKETAAELLEDREEDGQKEENADEVRSEKDGEGTV